MASHPLQAEVKNKSYLKGTVKANELPVLVLECS